MSMGIAAREGPGPQSADQAAAQTAQSAERAVQSAEQARATADRIIENAIQEAERAGRAQREAASPGEPAAPPSPPGRAPIVFSSDNGRSVSVSMDNGNLVLSQEGNTQVIPFREIVPDGAVQIAWAIPATLSILLIWWPLSRAVIRWINRKHVAQGETAAIEVRLRERFESLERNVDTVAIEVERLAEGQRFTNRLVAERGEQVPVNGQR